MKESKIERVKQKRPKVKSRKVNDEPQLAPQRSEKSRSSKNDLNDYENEDYGEQENRMLSEGELRDKIIHLLFEEDLAADEAEKVIAEIFPKNESGERVRL